jgi:NADH:ubiquinone oxidoreductase subunit F (NADH-binding)
VTLVVNGAESEWLSAKDAVLLQLRPHLVLDGAALLAETVGADRTIVWLHGSASGTRRAVELACRERTASGCDEPPVRIMTGPSSYLAGESTAVKSAVRGGPALPSSRVTRDRGVGPRTLVHNVETLARLTVIAGSTVTASCERTASPPVPRRLLTVLAPTHERRVVEVCTSASLAEVTDVALLRRPEASTPVLLGGYGGTWARWSDVETLPVSEDSMSRSGHTLGPGIVAPLWSGSCGLAATAAIVGYLAASSAGQCGPCLFGLRAMADALDRLARGRARRGEVDQLRRDTDAVAGRGACHHPDGAVRLVRSALRIFAADVSLHAAGRACGRPTANLIPLPKAPAG